MSTNVAIYLRKSREDLETTEETLARHERMLLDYCSRNSLNIIKIYKEVVSGESIANRPVMQKLLEDVYDSLYEGVVVIEIERLSRGNQIDQIEIIEVFKKTGTKIYTLNKVYDLSKEEYDEEFLEFGLFMSRREYKIICRRLLRGRQQSHKEGYFIGSILPFGFSKEKRDRGYVLVPNEDAKTVELIFNKYLEGVGLTDICRYLNDKGIKPQKAKTWSEYLVRAILKNKTYIGYLHSKKNNNYIEGKHDPIIDVELFNQVQQKINKSTRVNSVSSGLRNPLAGLVYCSSCGRSMVRNMNMKNVEYLKCKNIACTVGSSRLSTVESEIIKALQLELKNFNAYLINYDSEIKSKKIRVQNEIDLLTKEISKKENMITRACEFLEEGIYSKDKYLERVNILNKDIDSLKLAIDDLKSTNFDEHKKITSAVPILNKVLADYYTVGISERNALLKTIIKKIVYTKNVACYNSKNNIHFDLDIELKV